MSWKNPYNMIGKAGAEFKRLKYTKIHAQDQARKKLWWDDVCRQICPDVFKIAKDHLQIDDFRVECLIVGKSEGTTEGIPAETAYDFQKKLMGTTLKGCIIQISEKLVPIPTAEAQALLSEAIYFNQGNQLNYVKGNDLGIPDENLKLDHEDMMKQVRILHDNKENMFHGAYIITIWAEDETSMKIAKSHIKGVMRENRILGELPLRRMFETFMTGQPGPDMLDFATIEMYSGLASIISPTINPLSPLAGTGRGIYFGNEVNTGKDVSLDFFSEAAPHVIMVGATGSGKTYALILLMIRLYLEGRKVMYLTKKKDEHTNYRAIAEYFKPFGGIIEVGPGRHNINPLQIIYNITMEEITREQAISIYDSHKEIFCAFMKTYCGDEYSINQDSFIDQTLNELYEEHGIKRTDPSTWKDPTKFPLMHELREKWEGMYKDMRGHRKGTCEVLINKTYKFSSGGAYDYINSPTDADFTLNFAVVDIVNVPKGLRDAMNVMVTGLLASQVSAATTKGLTIVIDEGGAFLREPELADMILTGLTQWRSQNTQLIFATQQFGDLETAKMSEAFMANTFFKMVFGANMDESSIPYVQRFLHLKPQHVEDLKRLKKGQCLLKIRNKYACVDVTSSEAENAIIKGLESSIDSNEVVTTVHQKQWKLKPQYQGMSEEHCIIFENWFEGEFNEAALQQDGYKAFQPIRLNASGTIKAWIKSSIMVGGKVSPPARGLRTVNATTKDRGQQTTDHYATVIQIAAYLLDHGFSDIIINHWTDVDVVATYKGETYAFEFEKDGSHSIGEIFEKFSNARLKYDHVYIVCTTANKSKVIKAVEPDGQVPYGERPKNMCTRGSQFEDLINDILAGKKQAKGPVIRLQKAEEPEEDLIDMLEHEEVEEPEEEVEEPKQESAAEAFVRDIYEKVVIEKPEPEKKPSALTAIKSIFKKKPVQEAKIVVDKDGFYFKPFVVVGSEDYKIQKVSEPEPEEPKTEIEVDNIKKNVDSEGLLLGKVEKEPEVIKPKKMQRELDELFLTDKKEAESKEENWWEI
jgi:hypothetical protein